MIPILESDQRRVFNLYFVQKRLFWDDEYSFWTSCGERVQSIYLKNNYSSILDVIKVIQFCPRLKSIKLECTSDKYVPDLLNEFNTVVEMNFIAPSVTFLHLHVKDHDLNKVLTNYHLQKIFSIFPCLTEVQLNFDYKIDYMIGICPASDEMNSDKSISIFAVVSMLCDLTENLEKLSIKTRNLSYYYSYPRSPNLRPVHGDITSMLLKWKKYVLLKT